VLLFAMAGLEPSHVDGQMLSQEISSESEAYGGAFTILRERH